MSNLSPCPLKTGRENPGTLTLELITERARFDALEDGWNALFERAGRATQVFQTFNWNWHWANHYLGSSQGGIAGVKLSIVAGYRDGKLVMVWPLVSERVRGITQIFWMGEPVSQYGDVLVDDLADRDSVLAAGWAFLTANAKADIVRLRRVRADSRVAPLIGAAGALPSNKQTAPFLDLASAPDFETYEQRYSSKSRRNRRRLARRLEEAGPVSYKRIAGGKEARSLAVSALDLKARWLDDRGLVSNAIADPRMRAFFADAAEGAVRSTDCIVTALETKGETAAIEVLFPCKGRLAVHVIVFDLKYEKAGVGVLLLEQGIRDAFKAGYDTIDMLAPGDNYKLDWADQSVEVSDWCRPLTLAGHTYARLYLNLVRTHVKKAVEAMPHSLRRLVTGTAASHAA